MHTENTGERALIFEVKGNSLDDGPGIRTVIFFKGCPLDCVWCHNPESKSGRIELSFDRNECIMCETCKGICTANALDSKNPYYIDREKCSLCMECVEHCPTGALSQVGKYRTVKELVSRIEQDIPFFRNSDGGITLSGGEPTMSMDFISKLLKAVQPHGISTLLETCGLFDPERFMSLVYPLLGTIYFDIKLIDEDAHKRYCGTSNRRILENFILLSSAGRSSGVELLPRVPLIPGITDTDKNLSEIAGFLKENDMHRLEILPYNPLWFDKCEKIGVESHVAKDTAMKDWMPSKEIEHCKSMFKGFEIS